MSCVSDVYVVLKNHCDLLSFKRESGLLWMPVGGLGIHTQLLYLDVSLDI